MNHFKITTLSLLLILLLSSFQKVVANSRVDSKFNVLFLFADDQRSGTINALGNSEVITPNIDKLVERGVTFTNTYIMGATSGAVCSPSRAMLLTGRNLFGIETLEWDSPILEETESMPETFRKAGYSTFGTGKNHNGREVFARGFTDGGEIFFGGMCDHWNVPVYHFDNTGRYAQKIPVIAQPKKNNKVSYVGCDHFVHGKHSSELFADATIDFLKRRDTTKPFFAYVPFTAPHDPRSMPKEYEEMYNLDSIKIPDNFLPQHPFNFGDFHIRDESLVSFPRTEPIVKKHIRDYYAMITHLDAQIGRIVEQLKLTGEFENTIIVYSADNGLALGQHGMMGKQNLYEHSIGIPLIISGPGIPENEKSDALCYLFDLFPTLCDIVDIDAPSTVQGDSFISSLEKSKKGHRDQMLFGYKQYIRAYRDGDYKLIEYFVKGERHSQLFNLEIDPLEMDNLLEQDKFASKYNKMKVEMIKEMKSLSDTSEIYNQLVKE